MLEIKDLSKYYGNKQVLNQLSIVIKAAEITGVVGVNGSGKTTFFDCIAGLTTYEGEINYPVPVLKDVIGYLETNPNFLSRMTGMEYLTMVCNAKKVKVPLDESKNIFDLPLGEYAVNYSTGMKKKLALTSLLLVPGEIYLFDEPFNGVDIESNLLIIEIIKRLKSLNKVILISSHIFDSLAELCDSILYLKEGMLHNNVLPKDINQIKDDMIQNSLLGKLDNLDLQ